MRPGQKKGGTNEKKRGSGTSGSHLFAGGGVQHQILRFRQRLRPPTETSSPAYQGDSLFAYCTEKQRELLELPHEELPVELIFHHWTETAADYETRDETVIAGVLQALRDVSVESESPIVSTDTRGLTFVTAQGDTYSFWFDKRRFEGVDGRCYVLSEDEKLWELAWGIRTTDPEYQDLMR